MGREPWSCGLLCFHPSPRRPLWCLNNFGGSMCDTTEDGVGINNVVPAKEQLKRLGLRSADLAALLPMARELANWRENRDSHIGFVGYNKTVSGNKVLIAVDREYDLAVPNAVAEALREKGAHVDVLVADMGKADRAFDYLDEV